MLPALPNILDPLPEIHLFFYLDYNREKINKIWKQALLLIPNHLMNIWGNMIASTAGIY